MNTREAGLNKPDQAIDRPTAQSPTLAEVESVASTNVGDELVEFGDRQPAIDSARLAELYLEYAAPLTKLIVGIVRDSHAASDLLQSVFVKALEKGHLADPEKMKGWLYQVASNEAISYRRRQGFAARAKQQWQAQAVSREAAPTDPLVRRELAEKVQLALSKLPAEQAEVVRRRLYLDQTFAEIAAEQQTALGTVLTRMRLAMVKLREMLEEF